MPDQTLTKLEFWGNTEGNDMMRHHVWEGYAYACDKFCEQIQSALRIKMGYYMELRREDGSVIARCSTHPFPLPEAPDEEVIDPNFRAGGF